MSLALYCRECALNFESLPEKEKHNEEVHYGFAQPYPEISEKEFELMSSWNTHKLVHHCPVCFRHFRVINHLIEHLVTSHPIRCLNNPLAQTSKEVVENYWKLLDHVLPGERANSMRLWKADTVSKKCPYCPTYNPALRLTYNHIRCYHHRRGNNIPLPAYEKYLRWKDHVENLYPGQLKKMDEEFIYGHGILDQPQEEDFDAIFLESFPF
ncbi:hypothetical protein GCK72_012247 [Caenorhabditis remanei]|uniref:C2H2-type domain-containing protein n=1 Tax=Caenorhabditis remanei TaxID=31234 RepID=A0A6A5GKF2_CAERE|nr:hypothetical protein GCK72_012247 [Caenorhabditis remanei]KAF1755797.1 hypothetical protein GCK72_012247 [Caenorhabditis remanei]